MIGDELKRHSDASSSGAHQVPIAVLSPSFSACKELMDELRLLTDTVSGNTKGKTLSGDEIVELVNSTNAEIIVNGLEALNDDLLSRCPTVKFVAKYGVGVDNIDMEALTRRQIELGWTPGVNRRSVSELVVAFLIGHFRNVIPSVFLMRDGTWKKCGGRLLSSTRIGIVGFGCVGSDLAHVLAPFGCEILSHDIIDKREEARAAGVRMTSYAEILETCDAVSFHVPGASSTRHMFSCAEIEKIRPGALIVNTSRGQVVDFDETLNAVESGKLGGYASDVFPREPINLSEYRHPNLYFTPHIGGNAHEAVIAMGRSAITHMRTYINNRSVL